ncbi:MAG TPA: hypothetical protein VMV49_18040 [Candidatus Deferrimicrobium sp.]|nr:hypothetical protein [Candidatus Deferrimicrobium sp.]
MKSDRVDPIRIEIRSSTWVAHTDDRNLWGLNTILEIFKKGTLHTTDQPIFQLAGSKTVKCRKWCR